MAIDYSNIDSIISGFDRILSLSSVGSPPPIPTPMILVGVPKRGGLSAIKIATRIISRKSEAGLPVGPLPNGNTNPDEIMERIRIEEIIRALQEDAIISVAIPPVLQFQQLVYRQQVLYRYLVHQLHIQRDMELYSDG